MRHDSASLSSDPLARQAADSNVVPPLHLAIVPGQNSFCIAADGTWPAISFVATSSLDIACSRLHWAWTLAWNGYFKTGTASSTSHCWTATEAITGCGGTLTVTVQTESTDGNPVVSASASVTILGTNPDRSVVTEYLAKSPDGFVFSKIVEHEYATLHFDRSGYPRQSFDKGFGFCQLTNPQPTFEQCWDWRQNLDCGLNVFSQKQKEARAYLFQGGTRCFTDRQLALESVARWNGGKYHVWNEAKGWIRNPAILCDRETGNIGWSLTDPANAGKSVAELHARDAQCYGSSVRSAAHHWGYFGICYADRLLGEAA